ADVVHLLEERIVLGQVRVRRHRVFVGAVDEPVEGRGADHVVGAGLERVLGALVLERHRAREVHRVEGAGGVGVADLQAALAGAAPARRARDHGVVEGGLGALVEVNRAAAAGTADVGDVGHARVRVRGAVDAAPLVHAVTAAGTLDHDAELDAAVPAGVGVDRVIVGAGHDQVAGVHGAAEDLDAVVGAVVDVDILQHRAAARAG